MRSLNGELQTRKVSNLYMTDGCFNLDGIMSDIVEDLLFGPEIVPEVVEEPSSPIPKKTRPRAEDPAVSPPGLLDQISKAIDEMLNLGQSNSKRLDDIEKRLGQPVQFRTSEHQTESQSAARPAQGKPTGQDGQ